MFKLLIEVQTDYNAFWLESIKMYICFIYLKVYIVLPFTIPEIPQEISHYNLQLS